MAENRKIFKRIARREYWSKCNVYGLDKLYKLIESFFFQFSESYYELTTIFFNNGGVGFIYAWEVRRHLCWSARVLVSFCLTLSHTLSQVPTSNTSLTVAISLWWIQTPTSGPTTTRTEPSTSRSSLKKSSFAAVRSLSFFFLTWMNCEDASQT